MIRATAAWILACGMIVTPLAAQDETRNEIGLLLGGTFTPDQSISGSGDRIEFGAGLTFQVTYARHLWRGDGVRLSIEVPFLAAPSIKASSANLGVPQEYASLFITPGPRLHFLPDEPFSPWVSAGFGYALFEHANELLSGERNSPGNRHRHTGSAQFGAGVEIRTPVHILFPISLRLEVRDLYAGKPTYNVGTGGGFQHNLVFSGGFTVHF